MPFEDLPSKRPLLAVAVAIACSAPAPVTKDASADTIGVDAAFDCAAKLRELDSLGLNASACGPGDGCQATIASFCCPIYVVSSASDNAQAFRQAYDAYRAAGCVGTLCSAKPCKTTPACIAGKCSQP